MVELRNEHISVKISPLGAELKSIMNLATGEEMLWQGDSAYWARQSPVLFPIVGSVWDGKYRYNGKEYKMGQHGFARDMEFTLISESQNSATFELRANEETKKLYPADFVLQITYTITEKVVKVSWMVENPTSEENEAAETLHFQIGAHPGFNYRNFNPDAEVQGYFNLLPVDLNYRLSTITEKGCIDDSVTTVKYTEHCIIPITRSTFNRDALILEDSQAVIVDLLDSNRVPYIRLCFDAPVIGLWSPAKDAYAPFVCIEPWYGRCDKVGYEGEFAHKDWMQHLKAGEKFIASYTIELM